MQQNQHKTLFSAHGLRLFAVAFIIGAAVFTTGDQTASAKITANATAFAAHNAPLHSRISTPPPPPALI